MKNLILKYLQNDISTSELSELKNWLKDVKNQKIFKEIVKVQYQMNLLDEGVYDKKALDNIYEMIDHQAITYPQKPRLSLMSKNVLKYAALFVGILAMTWFSFFEIDSDTSQKNIPQSNITLELGNGDIIELENQESLFQQSQNGFYHQEENKLVYTTPAKIKEPIESFNTLRIPHGKTFEVILSDGSRVLLNAGSEFTYPVSFVEGKSRDVFLKGEAFFKVTEDKQRPFNVRASKLKVTVLGTSFNVSAYENKKEETTVVLVSGKIAASLGENLKKHILKPGDRATVKNNALYTDQVDVKKYIAWTTGKLIFMDEQFDVVKLKLERQYNIEIINKYKKLEEIPITGTLEAKDIEEVLKVFQHHTPFNFKRKGRTITLTKPQ